MLVLAVFCSTERVKSPYRHNSPLMSCCITFRLSLAFKYLWKLKFRQTLCERMDGLLSLFTLNSVLHCWESPLLLQINAWVRLHANIEQWNKALKQKTSSPSHRSRPIFPMERAFWLSQAATISARTSIPCCDYLHPYVVLSILVSYLLLFTLCSTSHKLLAIVHWIKTTARLFSKWH